VDGVVDSAEDGGEELVKGLDEVVDGCSDRHDSVFPSDGNLMEEFNVCNAMFLNIRLEVTDSSANACRWREGCCVDLISSRLTEMTSQQLRRLRQLARDLERKPHGSSLFVTAHAFGLCRFGCNAANCQYVSVNTCVDTRMTLFSVHPLRRYCL
jgi:hypothetical protein